MRKQFKTMFAVVSIAVASMALSTAAQADQIWSIEGCIVMVGKDKDSSRESRLRMLNLKSAEYIDLGRTHEVKFLTAKFRTFSQGGESHIIPSIELRKKLIDAYVSCNKE
tara:strand:- start:2691 stop:3020 length:330 start_codon:yes stop_codon:yes gene_type:complete